MTQMKVPISIPIRLAAWLLLLLPAAHLHAAEPQAGPNGHQLVLVPSGKYPVGHPDSPRNPRREVTLKSYAIADTETTNAQFAVFVAAAGYVTDAEKMGSGKVATQGMRDWAWDQVKGAHWRRPMGIRGPGWEELRQHPVTQISGADAEAYCTWLTTQSGRTVRLPTLEEWEVAARAGVKTPYPWGKAFDPTKANIWNGKSHYQNTLEDGFLYTAPVKSFPPNAWGLHDVIGNVFEYCSGLPEGTSPQESARLVAGRGGSWWCSFGTCDFFNLTDIGQMDRHGSLANQGFRVVMVGLKME